MQRLKPIFGIIFSVVIMMTLIGCGGGPTGTLEIYANGEDFVRDGFVSKDGWQIDFDRVQVTIENPAAYQTDPPYDASTGETPDGNSAGLTSNLVIELTQGPDPILIGSVEDVSADGQYNAVSWSMPADAVRMVGVAAKDDQRISFDILVDEAYAYTCGEFIGDGRKGFVAEDGTGDVELTFHFDHIFGDGDSPLDDGINVGALGFDPLAAISTSGALNARTSELSSMLSAADHDILMDNLATLGHVGEGHCYEATSGYTDKN